MTETIRAALRLAAAAASISLPALAFAPVAQAAGTYTAELAAPVKAARTEVVGESVWSCAGTTCSGPQDGARPLVACQQVSRRLGEVARFTAPAGVLTAEELARCNRH